MEWLDFLGLLSKGAGNDLMFKKKIENPEDIANTIVSLANNLGGRIIIGIDINNSHLTGTNLNTDWVRTVAKTHCFPAIHITTDIVTKNNRDIMVIDVPEGKNKPYVADRSFLFSETNYDNTQTINPIQNIIQKQLEHKETISQQNIEEIKAEEKPVKSFFQSINQRQKSTLEYLNSNENITNRKYRELFGISHKTAHLELTSLVDKGVLVSKGLGRSTHYILASKDNVPPMIKTQSTERRAERLESSSAKASEDKPKLINPEDNIVKKEVEIIEEKPFIQEELIKEDIQQTNLEIKPLIKNNEDSTEITIEVKDKNPKIIIHKHSHAKEMLENKILKDTIHRSKDFEKCQAYYANREDIKFNTPSTPAALLKENKEEPKESLDYNKILKEDNESKTKEILQEEKELMDNKQEEISDDEETIKRPKIKEKSELKNSFRNIEKDREKRLNKPQKNSNETEEFKYEPVDKSETNIIIDNPDVEITIKDDETTLDSENKEIIEDGPDQLGLDSFLST